jgi:hypothetical protein
MVTGQTTPERRRKTTIMTSQRISHRFISQFVDSVTVRPFLNDLRRMKRATSIVRTLPRLETVETRASADAA